MSIQAQRVGQLATELTLPDLYNKEVKLSNLKGKYVYVSFWASFSHNSVMQLRQLQQVYDTYNGQHFSDGQGFEVFSVTLDKEKKPWQKTTTAHKVKWRYNCGDLLSYNSPAVHRWGVFSIPASFLISPEGIIIGKDLSIDELEKELENRVETASEWSKLMPIPSDYQLSTYTSPHIEVKQHDDFYYYGDYVNQDKAVATQETTENTTQPDNDYSNQQETVAQKNDPKRQDNQYTSPSSPTYTAAPPTTSKSVTSTDYAYRNEGKVREQTTKVNAYSPDNRNTNPSNNTSTYYDTDFQKDYQSTPSSKTNNGFPSQTSVPSHTADNGYNKVKKPVGAFQTPTPQKNNDTFQEYTYNTQNPNVTYLPNNNYALIQIGEFSTASLAFHRFDHLSDLGGLYQEDTGNGTMVVLVGAFRDTETINFVLGETVRRGYSDAKVLYFESK
ncbi:MAG: peroxiredoxin family protein [Chitinophagales bacterium]